MDSEGLLPLTPPVELRAGARAEWDRVVAELKAKDLLTELDRAALAAYCGAYALWAEAIEAVQKFGSVVKTAATGFPVQSPYVAIANKQAAVMMRIASDFGFTPATRDRQPKPGRHARFDLFGDPVPDNWGRRGRPEHIATQKNRNKVILLLAMGWSNERIARALAITAPTLRKSYRAELHRRAEARDRMDASLMMRCWELIDQGNVGAMKEFSRLLERNDLMLYGQTVPGEKSVKPAKLGKKDQAIVDARTPDIGTTLGELMARRQGALN